MGEVMGEKIGKDLAWKIEELLNRPAEDETEIKIQPGRIGIDLLKCGRVLQVEQECQANDLGVQPGWLISKINGEPYTEELLDLNIAGKQPYTVTFVIASFIDSDK